MSTESSLKRILRGVMKSIADECDQELVEARALFGDKINEHLVSPVLQKVYKDLFPYVCAVAAVLVFTLVFVVLMLFIVVVRA